MKKLTMLAVAAGAVFAIAAPAASAANVGVCTISGQSSFTQPNTTTPAGLTGTPTLLGFTFSGTANCVGQGALSGSQPASASGTGLLSCSAGVSGIAGEGKGTSTIGGVTGDLQFVAAGGTVQFKVTDAAGSALGSINFFQYVGQNSPALEQACNSPAGWTKPLQFSGVAGGTL